MRGSCTAWLVIQILVPGSLYEVPEDLHKLPPNGSPGFTPSDWARDVDAVLARGLDAIAMPPNDREISRPYTFVHVSQSGVVLKDEYGVCRGPHRKSR